MPKVSSYTAFDPISGSDVFYAIQGGVSGKVIASVIRNYIVTTLGTAALNNTGDFDAAGAAAAAQAASQPLDAQLTALAGLSPSADQFPYFTALTTAALATITSYARTLLDDADAATARTTLGLGTAAVQNVAAFLQSANNLSDLNNAATARTNLGLVAVASSGSAADLTTGTLPAARMPALTGDVTTTVNTVATTIAANVVTAAKMSASATNVLFGRSTAGAGGGEEITCTSAGRALIDDADASAQRTTLGLGALATLNRITLATLPSDFNAPVPGGRLTTETLVPISGTVTAGRGTLYYTPFLHAMITVPDGSGGWTTTAFAEMSRSLTGALTTDKNYDVFAYLNSGTLTFDLGTAWTSNSARSLGLSISSGRWCNSSSFTSVIQSHSVGSGAGLYLGTIRASASGTTEDSASKRFVYNQYNQVVRYLNTAITAVHSYTTSAWRRWNTAGSASAIQIMWVLGQVQGSVFASASGDLTTGYVTPGINGNISAGAAFGGGTAQFRGGYLTISPFAWLSLGFNEGDLYEFGAATASFNIGELAYGVTM